MVVVTNNMVNGWKITAIIFIIIFILETAFFIYSFNLGTEMIEKENECAYNVCNNYDSYAYDDYAEICYCYNDNELQHEEYIR